MKSNEHLWSLVRRPLEKKIRPMFDYFEILKVQKYVLCVLNTYKNILRRWSNHGKKSNQQVDRGYKTVYPQWS